MINFAMCETGLLLVGRAGERVIKTDVNVTKNFLVMVAHFRIPSGSLFSHTEFIMIVHRFFMSTTYFVVPPNKMHLIACCGIEFFYHKKYCVFYHKNIAIFLSKEYCGMKAILCRRLNTKVWQTRKQFSYSQESKRPLAMRLLRVVLFLQV